MLPERKKLTLKKECVRKGFKNKRQRSTVQEGKREMERWLSEKPNYKSY